MNFHRGVVQTVTVNGGLDLGKVFHAGASYSKGWTTDDTTGTTTTVNCPKGRITCAAAVTPSMRKVTGYKEVKHQIDCDKRPPEKQHFEIEVPNIVPDAPKNQQAIMKFEACLVHKSKHRKTDLKPCPPA